MNIDEQVNGIVQNLIAEITTKVQTQVAQAVNEKINEAISKLDTQAVLANVLSQKLDAKISQLPIDTKSIEAQIQKRVESIVTNVAASVQTKSVTAVTEAVNAQVNRLDFQTLTQSALTSAIKNQSFNYPESSIPGSAINPENWTLSGNVIKGGIIANFGSTGIDDRATACQLTILDDITVVENNLLTKDLTVKGSATIEGDLNITGTIPDTSPAYRSLVRSVSDVVRSNLDQVVFSSYAGMVFDQIKQNGLDVVRLTINGQEVINGSELNRTITTSNLQKVGQLRELQVTGETFLSGALYTTAGRVGINTVEPNQTLTIWDQEVEFGFSKKTTDTAVLGLPRSQTLIISSNNKNNLTLKPDGSVSVNQLKIGVMTFSVSDAPPNNEQPKGTVVFNSNPSLGGPLGWVSLGGANWANFGIID